MTGTPGGLRQKHVVALAVAALLMIVLAACTRLVTHEPGSVGYDAIQTTAGTSFANSQDVKAYDGDWEGKAHIDAGGTGTPYARGVINAKVANGKNGFFGGAFYLPPGTLDGPSPKQTGDVDIMGWNYAAGAEFGGIRIGQDHRARLVRGNSSQMNTIGSPFLLQEGCWNWIAVRQKLSDKPASDPAHALSWVYVNGQKLVDSNEPNNFGHGADDVRFGLVSVDTATQDQALDVYVDDSFIANNDERFAPPTQSLCNAISGASPSAIGMSAQTPLSDATKFLYTGDFPIQHGVSSGTIEDRRAAVIRGRVLERSGTDSTDPLGGARVLVVGHPELGYTTTRPDGNFYLAVNGGGELRVRIEKDGYLPVERQQEVPWQDYSVTDDVVMTQLDANATTVDLSSQNNAPFQVARGSSVSDSSGGRQATLLFAQGTSATMKMADGSSQPIAQPMKVRASEYTVGDKGPEAMPAELPPTSGYTYAVDYTIDQAASAGATSVEFTGHPVISYTDNFLGMPVGENVPSGYYEAAKGTWLPTETGRVIRIIDNDGGIAHLAVTSADTEATQSELDDLGITDAERQQLAQTYPSNPQGGKTLWRARLTHFTPVDLNWAQKPDNDVPPEAGPSASNSQDDNCQQSGSSTIGCEDQVLGEHVDVVGSKFGMSYRSDRSVAHKASYEIKVPLTDASPPAGLQHVELRIEVAGQEQSWRFSGASDQTYPFTWDGKDAFGRTLQGEQPATVSIGYSYAGKYRSGNLFADYGNGSIITGSSTRDEVTFWRSFTTRVGTWDADSEGLGGWTLDVHHVYDPNGQTLYMGDGTRRSTQDISRVISTVAGGGTSQGEGVDASTADISNASGVAVASDGGVYYSDYFHDRVRRIGGDGKVRTVAGTWNWNTAWNQGGCGGDGGSATAPGAYVNGPEGLDVGPDGSLYIADRLCNAIRRVSPDGTISTVAGVSEPHDVAVADDGTLFVASEYSIQRIDHDGVSHTVLSEPPNPRIHFYGVDVGPDGSAYFTHAGIVQRLEPDGTITRVAGTDVGEFGSSGDGGAATDAKLGGQNDIVVLPDGSFYIADGSNHRLRYVDTDGVITRVAGALTSSGDPQSGYAGDGGPPRNAALDLPSRLALAHDGIYVADTNNSRVRFIKAPLPNFSGDDIAIPSEDGSELYQFDRQGRQLRTLNALTGATLYTFGYSDGLLASVTDGDGNTTTIERTGANPTTVAAPFGQRTDLTLSNGHLATVTNPNNEQVQLGYAPLPSCSDAPDGLLSSFTDGRNHTSSYCYDPSGRLTKADDRGGGYKTLGRSADGSKTTITTKLGRATTYRATRDANDDLTRTTTDPAGLESTLVSGQDGTLSSSSPDGMTRLLKSGPDPRFGMKGPVLTKLTTTTPDGDKLELDGSRQTDPPAPTDPFSLQSQTDTLSVNGHTYTTTYNASNRRFTTTSPQGRSTTTDTDDQGRPTQTQVSGIQPLTIAYDANGRLQDQTTQDPILGTRNWHYTYKGGSGTDAGLLDTVTDPRQRTTSFGYDDAGRVTSETLPGGRVIGYGYDDNGNLTSVTPPSRPEHRFSFSAVDLLQDYTPPDLGFSPRATTYEYDDDHDLTKITRPDGTQSGTSVTFTYDPGTGRLDHFTEPGNQDTNLSYSAQTGKLSSITTQDNDQIQFSYNGSLPKRETFSGTISASASRTYDDDLRVDSSSVNDAQTVGYSYDADGLMTGAGDLTMSRASDNGLLEGTSMAAATDHVATSLSYNAFGELATQSASYGQSPLFSEQITDRDQLGRITQKTETTSQGTHTYQYAYEPTTGFLDKVFKDGDEIADYAYDPNGNRQSKASGGVTVTGSYDNQDRLQSYGGTNYTFTEAGDLKTKNDGTELTTYGYDALGRLEHVTLDATGNSTNIDYVLDGFGRRIAKKVDGTLAQGFVYGPEALGPVAELNSQGNVETRFVYATRANVPDYMVRDGNTYRIITDHLGSPRMIVDTGSGQVAQVLDYDEYGNVVRDTSPGFQPFGFAGGLSDRDSELVHFGARDYDPEVGRWTTRDPVAFAGGDPNLYGYVLQNPVNGTDINGMSGLGDVLSGIEQKLSSPLQPFGKLADKLSPITNGLSNAYHDVKHRFGEAMCSASDFLRHNTYGRSLYGCTKGAIAAAAAVAPFGVIATPVLGEVTVGSAAVLGCIAGAVSYAQFDYVTVPGSPYQGP